MARARKDNVVMAAGSAVWAAQALRRGWTARYASRFARIALRHSVRSGSKRWLYAGGAAVAFRVLHMFVGRTEEIHRIKLRPGQGLEIREIPRAQRRA